MIIWILLFTLVVGLPSHAVETNPLVDLGMESRFQNILKAAEKSGLSPKETITLFKTVRKKLYSQLQAEARVELEALLSRDALYLGPLPVMDTGLTPSGKSTYQILTPNQLKSRAENIAQEVRTAFDQRKAYILKWTRLVGSGSGYKTCQAKDVSTTEIPLVELTTWANSYNFQVNKERGIRRFNEMYHRLVARARQKHQITLFDCMIAGLIHRTTKTKAQTSHELSGRPTVLDADTIKLSDTKIRLHGIDAPELDQSCSYANGIEYLCGVAATEELRAKIGDATIRCVITRRGKYQRLIGRCYLGEIELNRWLVEQGYALAYRPSSKRYIAEEEAAQSAKRGMWAGSFEKPWEWRKQQK